MRSKLKQIQVIEIVYGFIIIGTILFVLRYLLFHPWVIQTIDGEYHMARFANYHQALIDGQWPPRWASSMNFGFGYPIFNYNYPLPNIIASLYLFFGMTVIQSFRIIILTWFLIGGTGMYVLFRSDSKRAGFVAALVYVSAPYSLLNVYDRGSVGELAAFALLPWFFHLLKKVCLNPSWQHRLYFALITCLFYLSHNITVAVATSVVFVYGMFIYRFRLIKALLPYIIGLCLALWFWIPALSEMSYTSLSQATLNTSYAKFFKTLPSLINLPPATDYYLNSTELSPVKREIGYAPLIVFLISLYLLCKKQTDKKLVFWIFVFTASVFGITEYSHVLWQLVPPARFLQFPFRLLFFTTFAASILAGLISKRQFKYVIPVLLASASNLLFIYQPKSYVPYSSDWFYEYPLTSAAENELDPPWYQAKEASLLTDKFSALPIISSSTQSSITLVKQTGNYLEYQINTSTPVHITEKRLFFPGWETQVNGQHIDIEANKTKSYGLINYHLPAGQHKVVTRLTQNTTPRIIGNSLFWIGLIFWLSEPTYILGKSRLFRRSQ